MGCHRSSSKTTGVKIGHSVDSCDPQVMFHKTFCVMGVVSEGRTGNEDTIVASNGRCLRMFENRTFPQRVDWKVMCRRIKTVSFFRGRLVPRPGREEEACLVVDVRCYFQQQPVWV